MQLIVTGTYNDLVSFRSLNPGSQIHLVNEISSPARYGTGHPLLTWMEPRQLMSRPSTLSLLQDAECPTHAVVWMDVSWRKRGHRRSILLLPSSHRRIRGGTPRVFYRRTAVGGALLLRTHRAKRPDRQMIGSPSRSGWLCLCASGQCGITALRYADVSSATDVDGHPRRLQLQYQ